MDTLTHKQRRLLQLGVILVLVLFLAWFFVIKRTTITNINEPKNKTVYIQNSKLFVFDDTYPINPYPDKILMHYPYLMVIKADKPVTVIYNLEKRTKEKEVKDILLDYYDGNIVYNRKETYFNDQNLDKYCDYAFIRSRTDIMCVTKQSREGLENTLIKINPSQPNLWVEIYKPKYLISALSFINNTIYTGEIDVDTKQNYISVNKEGLAVDDTVNLIYPSNNETYFVSFPSELNNKTERKYKIDHKSVIKQLEKKIILYK